MHLGEACIAFGGSRCLQLMTSHACTREATAVFDICALPRSGKPPTATQRRCSLNFRPDKVSVFVFLFFLSPFFFPRARPRKARVRTGWKTNEGILLRLPCGFRVRLLDTVFDY